MLIVFAGPPCSGKSTLAREMARRLGLPHLEMDAVRARLLPEAPHTRGDRRVAYRAISWAGELLDRCGDGAILDAPYGHDEDRAGVPGAALIECRVSSETAVARFTARGPDPVRRDLTAERVAQLARDYRYRATGLLLDTEALSAGECLARIEEYLAAGGRSTLPPLH